MVDLVGSTLLVERLVVAATLALSVADHRARMVDLVGGDALDLAMHCLEAAAAVAFLIADIGTWVRLVGMIRDICVLYANFGGCTSREVT
jgi:hypothetical protein